MNLSRVAWRIHGGRAIALSLLLGAACAAGELRLTDLKASYHDRLLSMFHGNAVGTTTVEAGYRFVVIRVRCQGLFTADKKNVTVRSERIELTDATGAAFSSMGVVLPEGLLTSNYSAYISIYKNDSKRTYQLGLAYAVPADAKGLVFELGDIKTALQGIAEGRGPAPQEFLRATVKSAVFRDSAEASLKGKARAGKELLLTKTQYKPVKGRLLEVVLSVTPLKGNARFTDEFYLSGLDLALVTEDGLALAPWGFPRGSSVIKNGSLRSMAKDGKFSPADLKVFFPAPPDLKAFRLTYLGQPLASGAIGH